MQFNVVTWYSKLLSIIFFIAVLPVLTFYIGTQYQLTVDTQSGQGAMQSQNPFVFAKKIEATAPKINIGNSVLEGEVKGIVQNIYERDGRLWVNIDPADLVSTLECVFKSYDAGVSRECEAPNGNTRWNMSTTTIAMPLSEKAGIAVYYNDGTKIGLKPRILNVRNNKIYAFTLSPSTTASTTLSTLAASYNRILSYDGDDTYRWSPVMTINIRAVEDDTGNVVGAEVVSIEEVWVP
ncbi:MAG: hypothetical protein KBB54_01940 [Candidatus Pacebacteria bacterium]|nr:hypothetical protein [Candidatus Paceibacterota bacterium]MBP9818689.1 hypothetical protein [Candidatus Paceibacterota bacterium]